MDANTLAGRRDPSEEGTIVKSNLYHLSEKDDGFRRDDKPDHHNSSAVHLIVFIAYAISFGLHRDLLYATVAVAYGTSWVIEQRSFFRSTHLKEKDRLERARQSGAAH